MNPVAKKIQEARLKAKMSEKELAKKCGVAPSYIIQIESGKKIVNEETAERILAVFGEKVGFDFAEKISHEEAETRVVKKEAPKQAEFYNISPTDQWAGALANIIKEFPIFEVASSKVVGKKELPVLGKKVEGIPWDKALFVRADDDFLSPSRILKGDVLFIHQMKEYSGRGVYLIEHNQKRQLRVLSKESSNTTALSDGSSGAPKLILENAKFKILGKCLRVEFTI